MSERAGIEFHPITLQLYPHAIQTIQNEAASTIEGLIGSDPTLPSMPVQKGVQLNPDVINL